MACFNSSEKSACGTLFRYKLPTPTLMQMQDCYRNQTSCELENSSFTFLSKTEKITCKIKVEKYYSKFNFSVRFSEPLLNIRNWLTYAILTDETGGTQLKFDVRFHTFESSPQQISVLTDIYHDSLKKFLCDVGPPFFILYITDNYMTDTDWSDLTLKMKSYNEETTSKLNTCCKFSETFSELFNDNILTDVVIVADNKEFNVHKCILSTRSVYFSALFKHDVLENRESRILMKSKNGHLIKSDVVEHFLKYLYSGVPENFHQYGIQLYELAHMYNMETLQQECILYFKTNIDRDNAVVLLILSKKYEIKELQDCIFQFFKNKAREIFDSRNFKALFKDTRIMEQIDVVDQKGNITNLGTRFLLALDTSALRTDPRSIKSHLFHIKNAKGITHQFVLQIDQVKNEHGKLEYKLDITFYCHMDDKTHSYLDFYCAVCDKYGKIIDLNGLVSMPKILMSDDNFETLNFKHDNRPLILHLYVFHHIPVYDKLSEINDTGESVCLSEGTFVPMRDCKFLADISKLYMNSDLSDFKIVTDDKTFNVHKVVLAARSTIFAEYFKKHQNTNSSEQCTNESELTINVSANVVEEMLRYIYTDSVDNLDELAINLYEIGKQYNLADLQKKCISNISKKISVDNCMSLLAFAQKHNVECLYEKILTFFTNHANEVLSSSETDEFLKPFYDLDLSLENPELL